MDSEDQEVIELRGESEDLALFFPSKRQVGEALHPPEGKIAGLVTFEDGFDNIGSEKGHSQEATGAQRGLIVFMTPGRVEEVRAEV